MTIDRRTVLAAAAAALLAGAATAPAHAEPAKTLRVAYQKYGTLVLLKARGTLEQALKPLGVTVTWTEFPAGPQLLEALNVGAVDFGVVGEAPPIFAQAAGAPLRYVAYDPPAPEGEAILVPKDSPLKTVADLKGKTIALNKGSNVHYLLVKALEEAHVPYSAVKTAFLVPSDARAAFVQGAVDAWVIWDPYEAAAEAGTGARILRDGKGLVNNYQFYVSSRDYQAANPRVIDILVQQIDATEKLVVADIKGTAKKLAPDVGIPAPVLAVALGREAFGLKRVTADVVRQQQEVADTFYRLKLIPKPIRIADAWEKSGS
ncbi:MAG TPA: sulfonate ABC transporter substrate-binding protein [Hyphomicrobiales bacterium]|nr:sulfonate ABC transporter substrate-binding protein [Hyphomicrobiales bacterium]